MSYLNELKPAVANKKQKRRGRGIGSGKGKTGGRGHKGQKSRSGGFHKIGFEGGQMPLHRRLPKFGFSSRKALVTEQLGLDSLNSFEGTEVTICTLKEAGFINHNTKYVKIMLRGEITRPCQVIGIRASQAAKAAIEKAGGSVE